MTFSRTFSRQLLTGFWPKAMLCAVLVGTLSGCGGAPEADAQAPAAAQAAPQPAPELRVPVLMAQLGYFTDKVGWSVAAQNQQLAAFYLDKMDQVMEELGTVERFEGIPLGGMAQATMGSGLKALRSSVEGADWGTAVETYRGMTLSCNTCHAATRREFIVVTPVDGEPPYGQKFSAP